MPNGHDPTPVRETLRDAAIAAEYLGTILTLLHQLAAQVNPDLEIPFDDPDGLIELVSVNPVGPGCLPGPEPRNPRLNACEYRVEPIDDSAIRFGDLTRLLQRARHWCEAIGAVLGDPPPLPALPDEPPE